MAPGKIGLCHHSLRLCLGGCPLAGGDAPYILTWTRSSSPLLLSTPQPSKRASFTVRLLPSGPDPVPASKGFVLPSGRHPPTAHLGGQGFTVRQGLDWYGPRQPRKGFGCAIDFAFGGAYSPPSPRLSPGRPEGRKVADAGISLKVGLNEVRIGASKRGIGCGRTGTQPMQVRR